MMKYDDLYFANRYYFFTGCVEWYFLPKTEIKVFLKKRDIRGFGWRPSICYIEPRWINLITTLLCILLLSCTCISIGCVKSPPDL